MSALRQADGGLDWQAARARMASMAQALDPAAKLSPEAAASVLRERAAKLAQRSAAARVSDPERDALLFSVGDTRLAIEARVVLGILRVEAPAILPGLPAFFAGLINFRGQVVVAVRLDILLGLKPRATAQPSPFAILLGAEEAEFAVLADALHEIVPEDALRPPSAPEQRRDHAIRCIAQDGTIVCDGRRLLADRRLALHEIDAFPLSTDRDIEP